MAQRNLPICIAMIPQRWLEFMIRSVNWAAYFGGLPYDWKSGKLVITNQSFRAWLLAATIQLASSCFVLFRLLSYMHLHESFSTSKDAMLFLKAIIFFSWSLIGVMLTFFHARGMKESVTWTNSYLGYIRWFESKFKSILLKLLL